MPRISFYELDTVEENRLKFAVIMTRYRDKWIFVRHKERLTWEIPGGHREKEENINFTASRELIEETGAEHFNIVPVYIYSVYKDGKESFGQLFYSDVKELGELPKSEIGEIKLFDTIPENLTYPLIQPHLFNKVNEYYKKKIRELR